MQTTTAKVLLVGEPNVGKTSLCFRITKGIFPSIPSFTRHTNSYHKEYATENKTTINIEYLDSQGFETSSSILPTSLCRSTNVLIFVYDLNNEDSLKSFYNVVENVLKYIPDECLRVIVGNKCDTLKLATAERIKSSIEQAKNAIKAEVEFKVSAFSNEGVAELEQWLVKVLSNKCLRSDSISKSIISENQGKGKGNCCGDF